MKTMTVKGKLPDVLKKSSEARRVLPPMIANLSKNHYLKGFKTGGKQTDLSRSGWKDRKKPDKKTAGRRAILVRTAHMKNDFDIRKTTKDEIVLGTNDTDYASYHNDGTKHLPQREFVGDSKALNMKVSKLINRELNKIFK